MSGSKEKIDGSDYYIGESFEMRLPTAPITRSLATPSPDPSPSTAPVLVFTYHIQIPASPLALLASSSIQRGMRLKYKQWKRYGE
jgi:hypothetical protein